MRNTIIFGSPLLAALALAPVADAATIYVAPEGKADAACTREAPCTLTYAAENAKAGDTVLLMDGTYHEQLLVKNSGNSSAWLTFKADECATPIIEGKGEEPENDDAAIEQPTGVGSSVATYLKFEGLVSRWWNTGFGNGWTDQKPTSNGHWDIKYCISDGNGRVGFTMYSTEGIRIQNSIAAHNGSSSLHSWSSGISFFQIAGSDNAVVGSLSFENIDTEKHTDGNGFIADEDSNNVLFQNNIAFGNGGSCLRVTKSDDTKFINNTCFHNGQDLKTDNPRDPGEVYLTVEQDDGHHVGTSGTYKNNIFISTGTGPGAKAINPGNVTLPNASNNIIQDGGSAALFTAPEGTNADFTLSSAATNAIGKGASGAPSDDIGFDPKCLTKKKPTLTGIYTAPDWSQYSIDYDYIKSIGGVKYCFNPRSRTGTPDLGAYANGAVTRNKCVSTTGGTSGVGGASGTAITTDAGGTSGSASSGIGGVNSSSGQGGSSAKSSGSNDAQGGAAEGGAASDGGADTGNGGATGKSTTGKTSSTKSTTNGGSGSATKDNTSTTASNNNGTSTVGGSPSSDSGCGCRVADQRSGSASLGALGLLGLALLRVRRRRAR